MSTTFCKNCEKLIQDWARWCDACEPVSLKEMKASNDFDLTALIVEV